MTDQELQARVDALRSEAKDLLNRALGFNDGSSDPRANAFVDSVISAAMLQTALIQKQAMEASRKL